MTEIERVAKMGFRALSLPCKPIWGGHDVDHVNYNLPHFDPMWRLIEEADLPITFHVSTGRDPRAARGNGGAVSQLRHALAVADDRAGSESVCVGRAGAVQGTAVRDHRGWDRLGCLAARSDG